MLRGWRGFVSSRLLSSQCLDLSPQARKFRFRCLRSLLARFCFEFRCLCLLLQFSDTTRVLSRSWQALARLWIAEAQTLVLDRQIQSQPLAVETTALPFNRNVMAFSQSPALQARI